SNALNGIACTTATCTAVGAGGTILTSTNGGATWAAPKSGTTKSLNAGACSSATCYAVGGATGVSTILRTTDGINWALQTTNAAQPLAAVACFDASNCVAGGTAGTVVTTGNGTNWTQVGNPLSGPTSALNATTSAIIGIDAAACSS